jgi:hypothetical protein
MADSTSQDPQATSDDQSSVIDWANLPSGTSAVSLWDALHDAEIVSIRSNLLERTVHLEIESEHLRTFHHFEEGFKFMFALAGVRSARVLGYAIWPGAYSRPDGISYEDERKLVNEYQSKWREESVSWNEFEGRVKREDEQVFSILDATLASATTRASALKLCGQLNYATYFELYVRYEALKISGSDGRSLELAELQQLGEAYWEAFSKRAAQNKRTTS